MKKKGRYFDAKAEFRRSTRELLKKSKRLDRVKFFCPFCESQSILISIKKNIAGAKCSTCSITEKIKTYIHYDLIDIYGDLIDLFNTDQEIQKLKKRIIELNKESKYELKKDNMYNSKALCYSRLLEICRKKVASLELLLEDKVDVDVEKKNNWILKLEKYKRLEKDAANKLEKENKTNKESLFPKSDKGDVKKENKINDIFSDPGFLDF